MTGFPEPSVTTAGRTIVAASGGQDGYQRLVAGPGQPHVERTDLAAAVTGPYESLLTFAHLSDIHICDAQSPARVEFLNPWLDPDGPSHRRQELLTAQVADAMVRAINAIAQGPIGGGSVRFAIATGDNVDSSQANELQGYLTVMDGGEVTPDSGDPGRYEGVLDASETVPGLLDAARARFTAAGLAMPWLAVHGNHDQHVQGTVPSNALLAEVAVGAAKPVGAPSDWDEERIRSFVAALDAAVPGAEADFAAMVFRDVTPDPERRHVSRAEFVAAHGTSHGFGPDGRPYYRHDVDPVTLLVLDTVNEHGGWQGSLDEAQHAWLRAELDAADADRRYVVLASHHPLATLINDITPAGAGRRVLGSELEAELAWHPSLVLWVNGHTHTTAVLPHATEHGGWWEVTAPSLIDWPQQARIVELLRAGEGTLVVAATMLDHAGALPWDGSLADTGQLAGLSRELAANDPRLPLGVSYRDGVVEARNVVAYLPDPWVVR